MNVSPTYPPNIEDIRKVIPFESMKNACFTYGDTIHNPSMGDLDECIYLHEAQHAIQQYDVGGPQVWWKRWLSEPIFRIEQELVGYGYQFRRYCELNKDRNKRARYLYTLASDLSSEQYGKVLSLMQVRDRLKEYFPL